ncbi:hypothetical protein A3742_11330 [Oleiphilus sp. HI0071]|nr:hypothetical protein A3737_11670 [Oleiphilus sp. HI0065]KZY81570.1 hypothetical protein A3742_11330 [Oleiphilus sp. HI0071]KZZ03743.1 hypothetical protein A3744_10515 [Oleiphilus sp. HI0073]KZZ14343.1 hypothetical protein A3750_02205 [Oleiphilus sp. HI0079]KZZ16167.1 hypothetical protein A3751_15560 [Oleiphilus sp. HI0080]KZZ51779.1 hypothetical protein A3760_11625 [Oleiphilus sp. HI0122]KZZ66509.1 hypothetical protein A3765_05170 [Oleiphilus sp. HI0130]KZZ76867.1 hypothetical protein A37
MCRRACFDMQISLVNEHATAEFGARLAKALSAQALPLIVIYLQGELGAGKTTLVRSVLRGFGYQGSVKSPTYTLVEEYEVLGRKIYHFDLYRLADPEELEFMGMRDFLNPELEALDGIVCFVEWPEKGRGLLPQPDLELGLTVDGEGRVCDGKVAASSCVDVVEFENEVFHV